MTKYKKIIFKSVVPILLIVLFFSGCDSNRSGFDSSFDVALVATANTAKKTDIIYLDKNFKVLHKQSDLKYADFARGNTPPVVTGGHMYINKKDLEHVIVNTRFWTVILDVAVFSDCFRTIDKVRLPRHHPNGQ